MLLYEEEIMPLGEISEKAAHSAARSLSAAAYGVKVINIISRMISRSFVSIPVFVMHISAIAALATRPKPQRRLRTPPLLTLKKAGLLHIVDFYMET